ncbi:MAG: hypothetical protein WDZ40_04560 [Candidatus Spechtbacterales bacterium]
MPRYELQRAVGAYGEWYTDKIFNSENEDEARKIAADHISSARMIFGDRKIRIVEVVYEGNLYGLNHPIEDDDRYLELKGMQLAEETEMHLRVKKGKNEQD